LKLLFQSLRLLAATLLTPLMTTLLYVGAIWAFSGYLRKPDGSLNQLHWDKFQEDLGGAPVLYLVLVGFCLLTVAAAVALRLRDIRSAALVGAGLGALAFAVIFIALPARPFFASAISLVFFVVLGAAEALALAFLAGLSWRRSSGLEGSGALSPPP
jgi:hypothetical protein